MSPHRVRYEGPPSLAVRAATRLADTPGIELVSAGTPEPSREVPGEAILTLSVAGTPEAVQAAVADIQADLPAEARIVVVVVDDEDPRPLKG